MNIPNIDFFEKLITFIGLAIVTISANFIYTEYNKATDMNQHLSKNAVILNFNSAKEISTDSAYAAQLMLKIIQLNDFVKEIQAGKSNSQYLKKKKIYLNKQIESLRSKYDRNQKTLTSLLDTLKTNYSLERAIYTTKMRDYTSNIKSAFVILFVGLFIFIIGITLWKIKEDFEKEIILRQNLDKPTYSKNCQSCGKIFNSIVIPGSKKDENKNYSFCNECYSNGDFNEPTITFIEMENKVKAELISDGKPDKIIKRISNQLRLLDRWNLNKYL